MAASTQWRLAPSGHLLCLDYAGAAAAAAGAGLAWTGVFEGVRAMEGEVLRLQSEDPRFRK